jgi:hypothetical protein
VNDKPLELWTPAEMKARLAEIFREELGCPRGTVFTDEQLKMILLAYHPEIHAEIESFDLWW